MVTRTTSTTVRFSAPFLLSGFDSPQPAGEYRVDHDEESIDGVSWQAWHRTGSFIFLPAVNATTSISQMVPVSPDELDAALERDKSSS